MPTFDFPTLLWWGLPFAAAPLMIHLINLLRHRRVRFAAVEFLLASQRRYRARVLLRQVLLLALRTAAVLGVVLALAQPRWRHALGGLFGQGRSVHVILLDDSYSMDDRTSAGGQAGTSAFDRGRAAVARIVTDLAAVAGSEFAVGSFATLASGTGQAAARLDLPLQPATPQAAARVGELLEQRTATVRSTGPSAPLAAAEPLFATGASATQVLWLVGDYRAKDWLAPGDSEAVLRRLAAAGVDLRFVDCAASPPARNLTLERLDLVGGVPAAGSVLTFEVAVRNDGADVIRDLQVTVREDGAARPGLQIAEIPPGDTANGRFQARFAAPGDHVVVAELPADAVAADNVRTSVVEVREHVDVLLVDGDRQSAGRAGDAFYVATALAPGPGAATGLRPRIELPGRLAEIDLAAFDSIWLLDVENLEPAEVSAVETYARGGGGVVFFCGPRTRAEFVNRALHRGGQGLFPVPLAGPVDLPAAPGGAAAPDIVVEDHPVVAVLAGQRNPLLDAVRVDRVFAVDRDAPPPADGGPRRLLSLRTGGPLVVERPFGAGHVAAALSTAAPVWNNWARGNPSWVVVLLELESHVARGRRRTRDTLVGDPLAVRLEPGRDEIEVDFVVPEQVAVVRQAAVTAADGGLEARLAAADQPGVYAARWRRLDGAAAERLLAVNVDPAEGRLEPIGRERLMRGLDGLRIVMERAEDLDVGAEAATGRSWARPLLTLLFVLLVVEQGVALLAGYHPAVGGRPLPAGGAS